MNRTARLLPLAAILSVFVPVSHSSRAAEPPQLPDDLKAGDLLYQTSMADADSVEGWRMEGPGEVSNNTWKGTGRHVNRDGRIRKLTIGYVRKGNVIEIVIEGEKAGASKPVK